MQQHSLATTENTRSLRIEQWAFLFIVIHLICWTLAPIIIRYNLPLDSIEGALWGHQLEWGYDKNPFLNAWLTSLAVYLGGTTGWMVYLFSQLSVAICFFSVWQIARKILVPAHALIALMLLEGVQYYHYHAIDFNDNTLELSLWALSSYFLYLALQTQTDRSNKVRNWIFTGLFAGLSMMAKYYTAALLAGMMLFILIRKDNRQQLLTLPPYYGLLTFLLVITPHIVWLFHHQFITVAYVFERGSTTHHWFNHIFFPTQFIWQQFETFLPAIVLCLPLLFGKKIAHSRQTISSFDKAFLFCLGLGPLLLTALLSLIVGIKLRAGWGMPLLSLWSIILVAMIQPYLTPRKITAFISGIFVLLVLLLCGYSISLIKTNTITTANYPGDEIAQTITALWHEKFHTPLDYIAGSRWLGGNVSHYSKDHPAVFTEWDEKHSPWIDSKDFEKKGAIFVWDINGKEILPPEIKQRFPRLLLHPDMAFNLHRNSDNRLPPIKIGVAILPPK